MNNRQEHQTSPVSFRFSNIGPVNEATLQLGGLTVIAGRNNTGKTYIVYSLYGFLKGWIGWLQAENFLAEAADEFPEVKTIRNDIHAAGRASVPISLSTIARQRRILAARVGREFSPQFRMIFNSHRDSFRNARLHVELADLPNAPAPSRATVPFGYSTITIRYDGGAVTASVNDNDRSIGRVHPGAFALVYCVFLMRDLFPDPFILSAERFGISLFYRELDFTKNQIVDLLQKLAADGGTKSPSPFLIVDRTTSRYATPIKDNIDFTRSIPDLPKDRSALADHKFFDDVKNLVDGYYSNATDNIRFISKARGRGRSFNIPLHLASSSARGLSDLYFFLRYVAASGQLLIIDEPESHLDTRNQVLFARMLARFVTAGLRVLITTHSDYLVKELNNLIMLSRDFPEKKAVAKKLGYRLDEGLNPRSVRAYVAEGGGLTECKIGAFGIEMPVFDRTIDDINEVAIELSSRVMPEAGG